MRILWDSEATPQPFCEAGKCFERITIRTQAQAPNTGEDEPREAVVRNIPDLTVTGTLNAAALQVNSVDFATAVAPLIRDYVRANCRISIGFDPVCSVTDMCPTTVPRNQATISGGGICTDRASSPAETDRDGCTITPTTWAYATTEGADLGAVFVTFTCD